MRTDEYPKPQRLGAAATVRRLSFKFVSTDPREASLMMELPRLGMLRQLEPQEQLPRQLHYP
jgi:hypothetical protein